MTHDAKGETSDQELVLELLREWSKRARFKPPLPSGASDREEALRTGYIAAAIEVQEILENGVLGPPCPECGETDGYDFDCPTCVDRKQRDDMAGTS